MWCFTVLGGKFNDIIFAQDLRIVVNNTTYFFKNFLSIATSVATPEIFGKLCFLQLRKSRFAKSTKIEQLISRLKTFFSHKKVPQNAGLIIMMS